MTSSEAVNGPPSPTAADQQSSGFDANSSSNAINTPRPRVFKMSDEFLMFKFKIEMCSRKDRHDWKICPYAHPGEVARRRHPRGYTAVLCPAKTAASCPRREQCTFAHNPFEFWLHPDRFKTSLCNQGPTCDRPICFFAHKDEEVRRLPNGLVPAGPDDYVYATASSPDHTAAGEAHPPPPPPPPPRSLSQHLAAAAAAAVVNNAAAMPYMAGANPMLAAANGTLGGSPGLLLNSTGTSPQQLMMLSSAEESLLQQAGNSACQTAGADAAAAAALLDGSWLNCNSDPALLNSLTAAASRHLSSPVPLRQHSSTHGTYGSCSLPLGSLGVNNGMHMSMDPATAAAAAAGSLEAAGMLGMHSSGANGALSLAAMGGLDGAQDSMVGSAPAGYGMLQGEVAASLYQQQLLQQLQTMQQQQQQQQLSQHQQQQMLSDHLALQQQQQQQQQLQGLQYLQQAGMLQGSAGSQQAAGYHQLLQQQLAAQQHLAAQQQQQPQQQQLQHWKSMEQLQNSGSMQQASQQLAASTPSSQLLWMQQQQRQLEAVLQRQQQPPQGSLRMHSRTPPTDGGLAASLAAAHGSAGIASAASAPAFPGHSLGDSWQPYGSNGPASGGAAAAGGAPGGMIKWSSSILSKQRPMGAMGPGEGSGGPVLPGARPSNMPEFAADMGTSAGAGSVGGAAGGVRSGVGGAPHSDQGSSRAGSGDVSGAVASLEQLNGLMRLCRVTSPGLQHTGVIH